MRPIGIIDSGIGGLSVYKSIKELLPNEDYIYIADKKYFPYGELPTQDIRQRVNKIINWLDSKNVKLVVLACNTATVTAINSARRSYPKIPIVGTVPVIKTCAEQTKNGNIGIICTPKTAQSSYQKNLIKKFASNKSVYVKACPGLVEKIENSKSIFDKNLPELLQPLTDLKNKNIDTLALGCTHFPLIKKHIQEIVGDNVLVLDSAESIARQTKRVLAYKGALSNNKKAGGTNFYTTAKPKEFDIMIDRYLSLELESNLVKI